MINLVYGMSAFDARTAEKIALKTEPQKKAGLERADIAGDRHGDAFSAAWSGFAHGIGYTLQVFHFMYNHNSVYNIYIFCKTIKMCTVHDSVGYVQCAHSTKRKEYPTG